MFAARSPGSAGGEILPFDVVALGALVVVVIDVSCIRFFRMKWRHFSHNKTLLEMRASNQRAYVALNSNDASILINATIPVSTLKFRDQAPFFYGFHQPIVRLCWWRPAISDLSEVNESRSSPNCPTI
ncbi:hypothetical protein [Bradyrhizobium algeriense]|uniref:hypothetical protein n=1 Tax=Bradyrhizobium algeriense TaxID=634784 RepID=UPI00167E026C|nr:hypothetical protein [Bradyrhizobium algeriense]